MTMILTIHYSQNFSRISYLRRLSGSWEILRRSVIIYGVIRVREGLSEHLAMLQFTALQAQLSKGFSSFGFILTAVVLR